MKIISIKNNSELYEKTKAYCKKNRSKVYDSFSTAADQSVDAERFPQTWVLYGYHFLDQGQRITGFCQLTVHTDLTPFITTLFVDPAFRGGELYGKALLDHAREIPGQM